MEYLLHYCWKHKILPLSPLTTVDGETVEIVNPGLHNSNAGPDFFNAKVKIGGQLWVGNVEIHVRASDWYRHHHDTDPAYRNVILHVVGESDLRIPGPQGSGQLIPQLVLPVPEEVRRNYDELLRSDVMPRCAHVTGTLPTLAVHSWLSALLVERLEARTRQVMERWEQCEKNWETTFFVTLARQFGFGINGDAMEAWARSIPMSAVGKHRDDLFQIEAIFFGQSGLLNAGEAATDYEQRLRHEYTYLRHKFSLNPIDGSLWRMARLRPQNFPHIRLAQLATIYYEQRLNFSAIVNARTLNDCRQLLSTHVSEFWQTHYTFRSKTSAATDRNITDSSKDLLILNAISSILFAYGRYKGDETLCDRAFDWLSQLPPEDNSVIRRWQAAGIQPQSAADTQGLLQLSKHYCEPGDCLRCRFGFEFIRRTPGFLREESGEKS